MSPLAAAETHTFWIIALGIGGVVVLVVVVLMVLLVTFLKDVEEGVERLIVAGGQVAANTKNIEQLEATGPVLEEIKEEALIHRDYLSEQTR